MAMSGFRGPLFAEVFGNIRTQFAQNTGSGPLLKSGTAYSPKENWCGRGVPQDECWLVLSSTGRDEASGSAGSDDGQVRLEGLAQGVGELGAGHLACNAVIV